MKIGYARVSTQDQNLDMQIDALRAEGCEQIYQEKKSGKNTEDRSEFKKMYQFLRNGDTLVVWDITRLGRSVIDLLTIVTELKSRGVEFIAIRNQIDTSTPAGRLQFSIMAALAEYERAMIKERTMAGLSAAKSRGVIGGRPKGLDPAAKQKAETLWVLYNQGQPIKSIAKQLHIGESTGFKYLSLMKEKAARELAVCIT